VRRVRCDAADRPAGLRPTDATIPLGMEAPLSMARLGAKVNACGGTPTKRASALSLLRRFLPVKARFSMIHPAKADLPPIL
jgi:hypothetical protein